jgi:hypothetical protein
LRALNASPFTVPLNPVDVAAVVGVAAAVAVGLEVAVALFVGAGFAVAVELFVGVAAGFAVVAAADGVAAGVVAPPPRSIPPPKPTVPTELLSAGGVIERTAPNPVTVPAAIKIAFLIPALSRLYLRVL